MIICLLPLVSINPLKVKIRVLLLHFLIAFSFLGEVYSIDKSFSNDVLIYKIGEYANFTEVDSFINEDTVKSNYTSPPTSPTISTLNSTNVNSAIIGAIVAGSVLGTIVLGFIGFIIFKRYKKAHTIIRTP